MKCPLDAKDLQMTERQGIEIDYCPQCRGVWLDRGELDKLIERAAPVSSTPPTSREEGYAEPYKQQYGRSEHRPYGKHERREGFLGEIFDF